MKIVIIANDSNGLYLFRRQLIKALIEDGHEVTALTPFGTDIDNLEKIGTQMVDTPLERRSTNPFKDIGLLRRYCKELKRIKPDLVITYTIKPNIYGGIACRCLKVPYAANITGIGAAFEGSGPLRKLVSVLNKIALKDAKVVFFENAGNREVFVEERILEKNRTHLLRGAGVDLDYFSYLPYPNNQTFRFLFIGRIMKEKGVDELLEAMEKLVAEGEPCFLDILGHYEEEGRKYYSHKFKEYEKAGWLKYHGNQPDVRPFIETCDCFVLPSYHEGMSNVNLECASSGRPIITSNIPGCKEAVVAGSGLLCEAKNTDSLYGAMKQMMMKSRQERTQMGIKGRHHMEEQFDKKKVVADTINSLF